MILADLNQSVVVLQVFAVNPDGSEKTDVDSGTVRVYTVSGGSESDVLAATALVEFAPSKWRYEWGPASLAVGEYIVEFYLVDDNGVETRIGDDLIVRDIATQATVADILSRVILVQADLDIVKKVETGRWKIEGTIMTFYDDDETTPLLAFNLFDDAGAPSNERVFERVPVP